MADGQMIENPELTLEDWQYEVANGDTRLGYSAWLQGKLSEKGKDDAVRVVMMPAWAWKITLETLMMDARSHAFDEELCNDISNAIDSMELVSEVKAEEDMRLEDWRHHDGDEDIPPNPVDVSGIFRNNRFDLNFGDGRSIWIEQEGGVISVHCYDAAHDEPVNVRIGETMITVNTDQENGLTATPSD